MTRIRIYLEALAFTIQHSVKSMAGIVRHSSRLYRNEVRRLEQNLPF